jgi:hypothetical protein
LSDNRTVPSSPSALPDDKALDVIPPDGKALNECLRDLHAAITARPMTFADVVHAHLGMQIPTRGAEDRWDADGARYADGRRWSDGPHDPVARDMASTLIEQGIREGRLVTWVMLNGVVKRVSGAHISPDWREMLATGVYTSNEEPESKLAGNRLYVKQADWRCFVDQVIALREPAGKAPANRQLDHADIIGRAVALRAEHPDISLTSAAASIVAELPRNPTSGKQRAQRHIERMIARLWGASQQVPPKS